MRNVIRWFVIGHAAVMASGSIWRWWTLGEVDWMVPGAVEAAALLLILPAVLPRRKVPTS